MIKGFDSKRGISPVVATVLLITMAIIVIAIIWIWASNSISDGGTKLGDPISQVCQALSLQVTFSSGTVSIVNNGNTYAVDDVTLKDDSGGLFECGVGPIPPGGNKNGPCSGASNIVSAIPVVKMDDNVLYSCDNDEVSI